MRIKNLVLGANESVTLAGLGDFIRVNAASGAIQVINRPLIDVVMLPGEHMRTARAFDSIEVKDVSGAINTVELLIGAGEFGANRLVGEVSISANQEISIASSGSLDQDRFGRGHSVGGVAAQFSLIQIWNPLASGKLVVLKKMSGGSAADQIIGSRLVTASLTTFVNNGSNKYGGGAGGVAECRSETAVAIPGGDVHPRRYISANTAVSLIDSDALILPEGYGAMVHAYTVNVSISASFEWQEITI